MLLCGHYTFVGIMGLLLCTPAILVSSIPHLNPAMQQRRSVPIATAFTHADPPAHDPALRFQLSHEDEIMGIAFASNQNRLVTLGCEAALYSWNLKSGAAEYRIVLDPHEHGSSPISHTSDYHLGSK